MIEVFHMTSEANPIINEDYADLLIEYNGDRTVFNIFGDAPYTIINI